MFLLYYVIVCSRFCIRKSSLPLDKANWNPWILQQLGAWFHMILYDVLNLSSILILCGPASKTKTYNFKVFPLLLLLSNSNELFVFSTFFISYLQLLIPVKDDRFLIWIEMIFFYNFVYVHTYSLISFTLLHWNSQTWNSKTWKKATKTDVLGYSQCVSLLIYSLKGVGRKTKFMDKRRNTLRGNFWKTFVQIR